MQTTCFLFSIVHLMVLYTPSNWSLLNAADDAIDIINKFSFLFFFSLSQLSLYINNFVTVHMVI